MPARLGAVLTVIYLIFNEGYTATRGEALVRTDLCAEAIRLGNLVTSLMAPEPPAGGDRPGRAHAASRLPARRPIRPGRRSRSSRKSGSQPVGSCDRSPRPCRSSKRRFSGGAGPFALQAAIAALHCRAARAEDTDWPQILRLYDLLERIQPSPIVSLNRAVALAMAEGPERGLVLVDALAAIGRARRLSLAPRRSRRPAAPHRIVGGSRTELRASAGLGHQ